MDPRAQKVKAIVKKVAPESKFGTDPRDPWSPKANLPEEVVNEWRADPLLARFLKSRGIDPRYVSKDTMIGHSKSGEYAKWKQDHVSEGMTVQHSPTQKRLHQLRKSMHMHKEIPSDGLHKEEVDKKDTITFDIPLLIRVLELAREDLKSDPDLHKVVEKLINIRDKGVLTMDDYDYVSNIKEEFEITESDCKMDPKEWTKFAQSAAEKWRKKQLKVAEAKDPGEYDQEGDMARTQLRSLIHHGQLLHDMLKKNDNLPEWVQNKITLAQDYIQTSYHYLASQEGQTMKEDKFQDSYAATQTVGMEVNGDCATNQRSKSARMIKALYKKHRMKEEVYDHEKEDKSVATYGKKPKMQKVNDVDNLGENKPKAAVILSGGKTLTGEKRDTVEIDPMMRGRPNQPPEKKITDK